ncbi:MAG: tetratricopeptide repeat protein [Isosphaeraceae bacterium]
MRTRRPTIGGLMWFIFFVAMGLALARGGPQYRWMARSWFLLLGGFLGFQLAWFLLVPRVSLKLALGDHGRQRRILQWVVKTPAPAGMKILARYLLGLNDQVARRFEDAAANFRAILDIPGQTLDPGFESDVRQHLADTLESLGLEVEAAAQRKLATAALSGDAKTPLEFLARGNLLERQHRYEEAAVAYERALVLPPPLNREGRATTMMKLALATFNAGRPVDTVRWAEEVIASAPRSPMAPMARRLAALGCGNLGRLEDALRYARLALETADSDENRAQALALLGEYVLRSGRLDEAERLAREAEAILPGEKRLPWAVIGQVQQVRGQFDEAIRTLEKARSILEGHIPALHRRACAAVNKKLALLHAELGQAEQAHAALAEAEPEYAGDLKMSAVFDAYAALVHALLGDVESTRDRLESAERGRLAVWQDGTIQRGILAMTSRAALLIDEPELAEASLQAFHEQGFDPLYQPFYWYHLAAARRHLGDEKSGQEYDLKAASFDFGTRWERLARERLAAEGVTTVRK